MPRVGARHRPFGSEDTAMRTWEQYMQTMRREYELVTAARAGDVERLRQVVSPLSINRIDAKGYSALMLAAYHGHTDAVRFLLEAGADPNTRDQSGNTVLMGAAFKGHLEIVELLVRADAAIDARNPKGQTALNFAQMFGRSAVAIYLKSQERKPKTFGLKDVVSGWSSFILSRPQRSST
jgi:hypothetical protein